MKIIIVLPFPLILRPMKDLEMPIWKRPLCISEIGGNHEGCFQKALDLVELALETPADAVKLQTYFADSLVDKKHDPDRWHHFKKFELTLEQHVFLARKITDAGKNIFNIDLG